MGKFQKQLEKKKTTFHFISLIIKFVDSESMLRCLIQYSVFWSGSLNFMLINLINLYCIFSLKEPWNSFSKFYEPSIIVFISISFYSCLNHKQNCATIKKKNFTYRFSKSLSNHKFNSLNFSLYRVQVQNIVRSVSVYLISWKMRMLCKSWKK